MSRIKAGFFSAVPVQGGIQEVERFVSIYWKWGSGMGSTA
jgi:hypothetical protein